MARCGSESHVEAMEARATKKGGWMDGLRNHLDPTDTKAMHANRDLFYPFFLLRITKVHCFHMTPFSPLLSARLMSKLQISISIFAPCHISYIPAPSSTYADTRFVVACPNQKLSLPSFTICMQILLYPPPFTPPDAPLPPDKPTHPLHR